MTTLFLLVCVFSVAAALQEEGFTKSCSEPEVYEGTVVVTLSENRMVVVDDGIHQQLLLCISGKWSPVISGSDAWKRLSKRPSVKGGRAKRSPNTGKYSDLQRRVKVQRKLQKGLLETSIEENTLSSVRVHPGGTAYLLCRVQNLGAHSVTWTRLKDSYVLAIDTLMMSSDGRLSPSFEEQTGTWILRIGEVRSYDAGQYECQVSTRPPLKKVVTLEVVPAGQTLDTPAAQEENGLDYVLQNLTAIWEELTYLRNEVDGHFHGGHEGRYHHQVVEEVARMNHERHVHLLHHPHTSHNNHHDNDLLHHLAHHGLDQRQRSSHSPQGKDNQDENHDNGGEESEEDNSVGRHQDHHADGHDTHGLHALSDYDLDAFNLRDLTSDHGHRQRSGNGHSHDHDHGYGTSHSHHHSHDHGHGHDHESNHDHESTDSADSNEETSNSQEGAGQQSFRSPAQVAPGRGLALIPGREPVSTVPVVPVDPWMYGNCDLKPNVDVPESAVRGSITISQLKSGKGPVYFDLNITGFDVASTGRRHGFHVHDLPVTDGSCGSTGGHFNPHAQTHGAQDASVRHVGDLGNIEVDENGNIEGYILSDRLVAFSEPNKIIGRAIVVHAGEDDLGLGGDSGSLATGNAGGRLACCTIHIKVVPYFRFKG